VTDGSAAHEATARGLGVLRRLKRPLLYVMGIGYVVAGVLHFVRPHLYVQIVPPLLPAPLVLVYLSGLAEVAVGLGLLYPPTRQAAAWATIALLVAVFPANVYMATSGVAVQGTPFGTLDPTPAERWARLPLQVVLVAWAWWYTRPMPDG
jgi:uncharacterized membrane protein